MNSTPDARRHVAEREGAAKQGQHVHEPAPCYGPRRLGRRDARHGRRALDVAKAVPKLSPRLAQRRACVRDPRSPEE